MGSVTVALWFLLCSVESSWTRDQTYVPFTLVGGFLTTGSQRKSKTFIFLASVQFNSVTQSCPTLCDPMNRSMPGLPVHHQFPEFTQAHVHRVSDAIQPSHPLSSLLLLPPIPPSFRVFSNESTLCMRWPKYWTFSFSISPSNEP